MKTPRTPRPQAPGAAQRIAPGRRAFLGSAVASLAGLGAAVTAAPPGARRGGPRPVRFFQDPDREFVFLTALGRAYYGLGDIGKLLYLAGRIADGDGESAFREFTRAGTEARGWADDSARRGHRVSARQAYLWASNYFDTATYFVDDTADPSRFLPTWEKSRDCWDRAVPLFDPPVERIEIPYEGTRLRGYFFRASAGNGRQPLLVLNNGSDGAVQDMWGQGAAGGVARGFHCLTFDGPGQGYALWKQGLYFRPDWEKVITPVVDYALTRPDVDPKRIVLQGVSQGGYWAPRAAAFEHRLAALVADPGVTDVSASWAGHLPPPLRDMLRTGRKAEFDQVMREVPPAQRAMLRFRMRPYGLSSPYDVFKAAEAYNLDAVVADIRCPTLVTDPDGESFWPGQSRALYDRLTGPKTLVRFTAETGADLHCEPKSLGLRDLRVFDWLEETLG